MRRAVFDGIDIAQVCTNGHATTSMLTQMPETLKAYCPDCGAPTINSCPNCSHPIRGSTTESWLFGYSPPKFCEACGAPYPWTTKNLESAQQLTTILDELTENDKSELVNSIPDLSCDTPKTPVATAKVKRILGKLGGDAYKLVIRVLEDIATEAVKKQLGL